MANCLFCNHANRPNVRFCAACGRLLPGVILQNRYQITGRIASSAMSTVYLGRALHFGSDMCVVKEMREYFTTPQERQMAVQLIATEALLLRRLNHHYIPRVLDYFEEYRRHYVVMDYVQGTTLEEVLKRDGRPGLAEEVVLEWAGELCEVLEYLHSQNPPVIFRDLKPSNIMLEPHGHIKLIDFGISRYFKPGQTRDTWNMGTAGYAPPEQYGQGQTDARSDVYALGATLHYLLTGRDPSMTPFAFPPLRTLVPNLSANLEAIVAKALALDPNERYQSVKEIAEALANLKYKFEFRVDFVHPFLYAYPQKAPLCQLMITATSKGPADQAVSSPIVHVGLVLDVSGSMDSSAKYPALLQAVDRMVARLPEYALLTIALFSKGADLICSFKPLAELRSTPTGRGNLSPVAEAIDQSSVKFGNQTNLSTGLSLVLERVRQMQRPGIVHRLCILTDGQIHDADRCQPLFDDLRNSHIEVYAYGFGSDWKKEPLWSMLQGCQGGSFKPVAVGDPGSVTTYDIINTFDRFALAGRNIVATDAELEVSFARNTIPGDVFRYQPLMRYLGNNVYDADRTFRTMIGSLEQGIVYSLCFEVNLQPPYQATHEIGTATLQYTYQGRRIIQRLPMIVRLTPDRRLAEQTIVQDVQEAFLVLESLRSSDPQKLLPAFQARLDLLFRMNGDPRQIAALQRAIHELQSRGTIDGLSQEDVLWIETDSRGTTVGGAW